MADMGHLAIRPACSKKTKLIERTKSTSIQRSQPEGTHPWLPSQKEFVGVGAGNPLPTGVPGAATRLKDCHRRLLLKVDAANEPDRPAQHDADHENEEDSPRTLNRGGSTRWRSS